MSEWREVQRILAVRLDAMGDVLMTTPALRAIRTSCPGARITLLTSPAGAAVAALVPEIDEIIVYEAPWMKAGDAHPPDADLDLIDRLRRGRFDAAIVFTVFSQTPVPAAMACYLAGIPRILAHCRERTYRLISDAVDDPEPAGGIRHEVQRQLDLVATLGWRCDDKRLSLTVDPMARDNFVRALAPQGPWVLLHPGASAASRRYPAAALGAVARQLRADGIATVVAAGPGEATLTRIIAQVEPSVTIVALGSLPELIAVIAAAPLLIANNSGPAHIAAAAGTPVVSLYAATNPQHTPWMVPTRVLTAPVPCAGCFKSICPQGHGRCLSDIPPVAVIDAVHALLREPPSHDDENILTHSKIDVFRGTRRQSAR